MIVECICQNCQKTFKASSFNVKRGLAIYCLKSCQEIKQRKERNAKYKLLLANNPTRTVINKYITRQEVMDTYGLNRSQLSVLEKNGHLSVLVENPARYAALGTQRYFQLNELKEPVDLVEKRNFLLEKLTELNKRLRQIQKAHPSYTVDVLPYLSKEAIDRWKAESRRLKQVKKTLDAINVKLYKYI